MSMSKNYIIAALTALLWLGADLWTKAWAAQSPSLPWGEAGSLFFLSQAHANPGIAFGLRLPMAVQVGATFAVLAALGYASHQRLRANPGKGFLQSLLWGMLLGGALGNLAERLNQGYVLDFINLKPFPTFNLADVGITVGLGGWILMEWLEEKRKD